MRHQAQPSRQIESSPHPGDTEVGVFTNPRLRRPHGGRAQRRTGAEIAAQRCRHPVVIEEAHQLHAKCARTAIAAIEVLVGTHVHRAVLSFRLLLTLRDIPGR